MQCKQFGRHLRLGILQHWLPGISSLCLSILIAAGIQLPASATLPFRLVSTNDFTTNTVLARSTHLQNPATTSGWSKRAYLCWWDVKDCVRYGIPYLVSHEPWMAAAWFGLLGVLTATVAGVFRKNRTLRRSGVANSPDRQNHTKSDASSAGDSRR